MSDWTSSLWKLLYRAAAGDVAGDVAGDAARPATAATSAAEPAMLSLAYLGDAVFDAYVRARLVGGDGGRPGQLHDRAVGRVRAGAQARVLDRLEPLLTDAERDVIRRGRNARPGHTPRGTKLADYHRSTAFEALLGHLLWTGQTERLEWVLKESWVAADAAAQESEAEAPAPAQAPAQTPAQAPPPQQG